MRVHHTSIRSVRARVLRPKIPLLTVLLLCIAVSIAAAQDGGEEGVVRGPIIERSAAAPAQANDSAGGSLEQQYGRLVGTVLLEGEEPVHAAIVLILEIALSTTSHSDGTYEIEDVPPGTYQVMAQRQGLGTVFQDVTVGAGQTVTLDFSLAFRSISEQVTVTATAHRETTIFDSFGALTTLDSLDLAADMSGSLGEVLENEAGMAKRSFGAGNARPIIRGFDGDRVLIMQDGIRTGDLSSQSGDHGTSIDPGNVQRIEVVKGPATLLYGSNAIGGVVNAITPQEAHRANPHEGLIAQATTDFGTANAQVGGNGSLQYSTGQWLLWAGAGSRRTDDYDTPEGTVENSFTNLSNGRFGVGFDDGRTFFSAGYQIEDGTFGVPFIGELHAHGHEEEEHEGEEHEEGEHEEEVNIELDQRRQSLRIDGGMKDLTNRIVNSFQVTFNYLDWNHDEIEDVGEERTVGTMFRNETYVVRAEFEQQRHERFHGKFGVWGKHRDYEAAGEEALAPPTIQSALAGFVYEELHAGEIFRFQLGARVENNDYDPEERLIAEHDEESDHDEGEHDEELEPPEAKPRSFTGFSGSAGVHVTLPSGHALVVNFTRSYRAPALEELYNFGPHVGNLTFEIGNPDLERELSNGFDVSFRHRSSRARGDINFFYYDISDFVFASLTDVFVDNLPVARFLQGDSRFVGFDAEVEFQLHRYLWLDLGLGYVDAKLTGTDEYLPRIPPFQGRVRFEIPYKGLAIEPELVFAASQDNVFRDETPTDGYTIANLMASYTLVHGHYAHVFSGKLYNMGDVLYRNHTSFIKDLAAEMGRGVKFSYAFRFF